MKASRKRLLILCCVLFLLTFALFDNFFAAWEFSLTPPPSDIHHSKMSSSSSKSLGIDSRLSKAQQLALADDEAEKLRLASKVRPFSQGTRPVIRWTKGDGEDDYVTRSAIGHATRLFGSSVDYCLLTTPDLPADRVRRILEVATQPVEWWTIGVDDNKKLASILRSAKTFTYASKQSLKHIGYWWKWFPERVRPDAPELVLDGDQVIFAKPSWFDKFLAGTDVLRVSEDDKETLEVLYGRLVRLIDTSQKLYSGAVSLPPKLRYMDAIVKVMKRIPLKVPHDGQTDTYEQAYVAAAFQSLHAVSIPLFEFPFARAFSEVELEYGSKGNNHSAWGYHFGRAYAFHNPHFFSIVAKGKLQDFSATPPSITSRVAWLGNVGQWGTPGWSISPDMIDLVLGLIGKCSGKDVLELGSSRGQLSMALYLAGCRDFTTVDRQNRGARDNLRQLEIDVVQADAKEFLSNQRKGKLYDVIVVDVHGNGKDVWIELGNMILSALKSTGVALINNAELYKIPEWKEEFGIRDWLNSLDKSTWNYKVQENPVPGLAVVKHRKNKFNY